MRRLGHVPRNVGRLSAAFSTLQGHLAVRINPGIRDEAPLRRPLDGLMSTGGTSQALLVAVGQNELQGLGGTVFLNSSASHWVSGYRAEGLMYNPTGQAGKRCHLDGHGPKPFFRAPGSYLERPMDEGSKSPEYIPVADVEVSSVRHQRHGFELTGTGADRADYRVDLHLEVPVDQRTRAVLGELLSQSKWRISRRVRPSLRAVAKPSRTGKPTTT